MLRVVLRCCLLASTLALPGVARASTVVLHGPGLDSVQAVQVAKEVLGRGDLLAGGSVQERVGAADDELVVVGGEVTLCGDPGGKKRPLKGELVGIGRSLDGMDYKPVLEAAAEVAHRLPCLAEDATLDDLYSLFFMGGLAAAFDGQDAEARHWFGRAAALAPSREWPARYPPKKKDLYLEALQKAVGTPPAGLQPDVEGEVIVDGSPWDGVPRLHVGGHLIYVPSVKTGLWLEVPERSKLPEQGVLVTTGARLREAVLTGQDRAAAWLERESARGGWTEVVVVTEERVLLFKDGAFTDPSEGGPKWKPGTGTAVGFVVAGAGAALAGIGVGLNVDAFNKGLPKVGGALPERELYEAWLTQNRAGLGLAIAGGATAAAGLVVAIVSGFTRPQSRVAAVPWFISDGTTTAVGISGSLP